jgi:hypothetical protein
MNSDSSSRKAKPNSAVNAHSVPVEWKARAEEDASRRAQRRLPAARRRMKPRDGTPDAYHGALAPLPRRLPLHSPGGLDQLLRRCLLPRPLPRRQGMRGREVVPIDAPRPRALPQLHHLRLALSSWLRWQEEGDSFAHAVWEGRRFL